jgi:hypothetical protein
MPKADRHYHHHHPHWHGMAVRRELFIFVCGHEKAKEHKEFIMFLFSSFLSKRIIANSRAPITKALI